MNMKHVFIINPEAGQGEAPDLIENIEKGCKELKVDYEICETAYRGHGEELAREKALAYDSVRLYACGGDGTLNEVANGAYGFPHAEVACIPKGTGNDFVRNFSGDFKDIKAQILGEAFSCDLLSYREGKEERFSINMINIGFDSNVVATTGRLKKKPLISGSLAYFLSIITELIKKRPLHLSTGDQKEEVKKELLMLTISNGKFCGGGIKGMPLATTNDGVMDVCEIKNVTRRKFIHLFPKYSKGAYVEEPKLKNIIRYRQIKHLWIESVDGSFQAAIDGEMGTFQQLELKIVEKAISFSLPKR